MKGNTQRLGLSLAVAAMAVLPVVAEDTTTVKYTKPSAYVVKIPALVDLSAGATSAKIEATTMNIAPGHELRVSVASGIGEGKVTLTEANDPTTTAVSIVSLAENGEGIADDAVVAVFKGQQTEAVANGTLYFSALPDEQPAGDYTGSIVFSMDVAESE